MNRAIPIHEHVSGVERNVEKIEGIVKAIQKDIEGKDYREHLTNLQNTLKDTQTHINEGLPAAMAHSECFPSWPS